MAETSIQWTDATWNPVRGCTRVSTGRGGPNHEGGCYAEKIAARFSGPGQPYEGFAERTKHGGRWTGKVALIPDKLTEPLTWRKPRRIFVNSMSDLFHEALPDRMLRYLTDLRAAGRIARAILDLWIGPWPDLPRRAGAWPVKSLGEDPDFPDDVTLTAWPLLNVWLGTSVEDQETADERIPHLLAVPSAVRFLSCEPLLERLDLTAIDASAQFDSTSEPGWRYDALGGTHWHLDNFGHRLIGDGPAWPTIDWVIVGGESGPGARPCDLAWVRSLRDQCRAADVPLFVKQLSSGGAKPIKEMEEFPEDLRVMEFPEARS